MWTMKYLMGHTNAASGEFCFTLALTFKRDTYQHADMARGLGMLPLVGGFAEMNKKTGEVGGFHGESISCRVDSKYPPSMKKVAELMEGMNVWKVKFEGHQVPTVLVLMPKGERPDLLPTMEAVTQISSHEAMKVAIENCLENCGVY